MKTHSMTLKGLLQACPALYENIQWVTLGLFLVTWFFVFDFDATLDITNTSSVVVKNGWTPEGIKQVRWCGLAVMAAVIFLCWWQNCYGNRKKDITTFNSPGRSADDTVPVQAESITSACRSRFGRICFDRLTKNRIQESSKDYVGRDWLAKDVLAELIDAKGGAAVIVYGDSGMVFCIFD